MINKNVKPRVFWVINRFTYSVLSFVDWTSRDVISQINRSTFVYFLLYFRLPKIIEFGIYLFSRKPCEIRPSNWLCFSQFMSGNRAHEYFDRRCTKWNIREFLDECKLEPFKRKIDCYLASLQNIANREDHLRSERAQQLLDKYKLASK